MGRSQGPIISPALDRMLGQRDTAAEKASARYVTGPEKEAMAAAETPFVIESVTLGEGSYGKRWELEITIDGEDRILTIPQNRARDPLMRELARLCRQAPQGPLALDVIEHEDGTTFQWLKRPGVTSERTTSTGAKAE